MESLLLLSPALYTKVMALAPVILANADEVDVDGSFNFNPELIFNGMMDVIGDNIVPIMTLLGIMLGAKWTMRYFKKAAKGRP